MTREEVCGLIQAEVGCPVTVNNLNGLLKAVGARWSGKGSRGKYRKSEVNVNVALARTDALLDALCEVLSQCGMDEAELSLRREFDRLTAQAKNGGE